MTTHFPLVLPIFFLLTCLGLTAVASGESEPAAPVGADMDAMRQVNPWVDHPAMSPWRLQAWDDYHAGKSFEVAELNRIIAEGLAADAKRITIPPGVYHVRKMQEPGQRGVVAIHDASDVTIIAHGVTLMMHVQARPIDIFQASNFELVGLTLDFAAEALPFTQSTVTAVQQDGFGLVVELHDGYPALADEPAELRKVAAYDTESLLLKRGVFTFYDRPFKQLGPRRYGLSGKYPNIAVGDYVTLIQGHGVHTLHIRRSKNVALRDVTIHAAGMFAIRAERNEGVFYENVRVTPGPLLPGATVPRLKSASQDGINNAYSADITVKACLVECHSDDAVTHYENDMTLVVEPLLEEGQQPEPVTELVVMGNRGLNHHKVGEQLLVLDGESTGLLGTATIVKAEDVTGSPEAARRRARHHEHAKRHTVDIFRPERLEGYFRLTLDKPIAVENGDWVYTRYSDKGIRIVGCRFRNARGRGIVIKTHNSSLEHTIQETSDTHAFMTGPEPFWLAPGHLNHFRMHNNVFRNISIKPTRPKHAAAIEIDSIRKSIAPAGQHQHVAITRNTFEQIWQLPIRITSASDVRIEGNLFRQTHDRAFPKRKNVRTSNMIELWNVSDAVVKNNAVQQPGAYLSEMPMLVNDASANVEVEPLREVE